jgi:hypothetical protein
LISKPISFAAVANSLYISVACDKDREIIAGEPSFLLALTLVL